MFKSGYSVRIFKVLEDKLVDFFNYIPIEYYPNEESKTIYSPKLAELFMGIGSQIDTFFRNWCIDEKLYNKSEMDDLKMGNYKAINKTYPLDNKKIIFLITNNSTLPFENWTRVDPEWWTFYNNVKHNGYYHKTTGNLFNVIEALSALFLLNCVNNDSNYKLTEYGYGSVTEREYRDMTKNGAFSSEPYFRSQLFEYESESNISSYEDW